MNWFGLRALLTITLSWCLTVTAATAQQGGRFALVIGNSHYGGADDVSGIEDAKAMKEALQQIGFNEVDVAILSDGTRKEMNTALDEFGARIGQASVVVFFFSGHGFQVGVENYLVPKDGSANPISNLSLTRVKNTLAQAPNDAVKLVFLDACRVYKKLPGRAPQGLMAEQTPSSPRTLYAFAAGPNLTTPAGKPNEISTYSKALLHYLNEPGLTIAQLLDKVGNDSAVADQLPAYVINGVPSDFYLRDPVFARAETSHLDGNLLVVVNDKIIPFNSEELPKRLPFRAGHNELQILMSKGKSFHNGHTWDVTEGWGYSLKIGPEASGALVFSGPSPDGFTFSGHEDHPFKEGPRHGGTFVVAKATIVVDGNGRVPKVTLEQSNTDIWSTESPFWARDQESLFEKDVASLGLVADDILGALNLQPPWSILLRPAVDNLLKTGTIFNYYKVADPSQTFATVWGNKLLRDAVRTCMVDHADERRNDLKASIVAAFKRADRPFDGFDQRLTECVRHENKNPGLKDDDIRIWTAFQDRSKS